MKNKNYFERIAYCSLSPGKFPDGTTAAPSIARRQLDAEVNCTIEIIKRKLRQEPMTSQQRQELLDDLTVLRAYNRPEKRIERSLAQSNLKGGKERTR